MDVMNGDQLSQKSAIQERILESMMKNILDQMNPLGLKENDPSSDLLDRRLIITHKKPYQITKPH